VIASPSFPVDLVRLETGPKRIMMLPGHWPVTFTCEEAEEHARRVLVMVAEIRQGEEGTNSGRPKS